MRGVEYPVQRQSQLHHAQIGPQVSPGGGDFVDEELPDLRRQIGQLCLREVLQIGGAADPIKHPVSLRTRTKPHRMVMGMHAEEIAEEYPVVAIDSDALDAARLLAEHRLPGIVVTDQTGRPYAVLPASQVVRFIVPGYIQDDPSLAGVLSETVADRAAEKLRGKKVRDVLPEHLYELPTAGAAETLIEVASTMARLRSPLIAVVKDGKLLGVITASRLLAAALEV